MDKRCPLKLDALPCTNCPLGQNTFKTFLKPQQRCTCKTKEIDFNNEAMKCKNCKKSVVTCNWAIKSSKYNYCFWNYADSDDGYKMHDGKFMERMLNLTEQRIGQIIKELTSYLKDRIDMRSLFKQTREDKYE